MSAGIPASLRGLVVARAQGRCEYCGLSQVSQEAAFHIDHIFPRIAGGATEAENLALACVSCSLRKGDRRAVPDTQTGEVVPLFNPRTDEWNEHFAWRGTMVSGLTAVGRASVAALAMNRPLVLAIRSEELLRGRHPPAGQQAID